MIRQAQIAWNSLSDDRRDPVRLALTVSDVCLKLGCCQSTSTYSALEVSHFMCYINSRLTHLLVDVIQGGPKK